MLVQVKKGIMSFITSEFFYKYFVDYRVKNDMIKTRYGLVNVANQEVYLKNLIALGAYERRELALLKHEVQGYDVIELGSSLGVVMTAICALQKSKKVIAVEANPRLKKNLMDTKAINEFSNLVILNAAIAYNKSHVNFAVDSFNLGGHVTEGGNDNTETLNIESITLSAIVKEYNIKNYVLVCDIEGSEVEMLLNELKGQVLSFCKCLIIELHSAVYEGKRYEISDIIDIIVNKIGMKIYKQIKNVYVFKYN